ncbi:MBL fold metallo-hydrolase [Bacillus sp. 165]|uniref:MBL fold metallo-hydrolase n=1 Tax=Bacillus sp. 165 TaxID=1529117 RepID=UPI0032AE9143
MFPVNCYLIEEETELTVIDAALPYSYKEILKTAEQIRKPITCIVLTHAHVDHIGSLDALKNVLPEAKVYISAREAKLMAHDRSLEAGEPQIPIRGDVSKKLQTRPDVLLQDGDQIGSLKAVCTPGHTPGSMAFLDIRNNSLITGDALQTRGGLAVAGKINLTFPFPALGTWSKELSIDSARKLRGLSPSLLATGHGLMLPNPLHPMDRAIIEAEKYITKKKHM